MRLRPQSGPARWYTCRLARSRVRLDSVAPWLIPFVEATEEMAAADAWPAPPPARRPSRCLEAALQWSADRPRRVRRWFAGDVAWLEVEGVGRLATQGRRLTLAAPARDATPERTLLAWLGPAFWLSQAGEGLWGWHASAALWGGRLALFLGTSGQGKSTLAAHLAQAGWQAAADDLMPVSWDAGGLCAWPRYPQLKWPPEAQAGLSLPSQLAAAAVYVLGEDADEPAVRRLQGAAALLPLVRHTVAARLFNAAELRAQMDFCAQVAGQTPVFALRYPRQLAALPALADLLRAHLDRVDEL